MNILFLICSIGILIFGAEVFVNSSALIAKKLHVPMVVIALTIIAIGTSMPETIISITASAKGDSDLSLSNIIGSNFFNLLFIIGLCAIISPIDVKLKKMGHEAWLMVGSTLYLFIVVIGYWVFKGHTVPWEFGAIMVLVFLTYFGILLKHTIQRQHKREEKLMSLMHINKEDIEAHEAAHELARSRKRKENAKSKPLWLAKLGAVYDKHKENAKPKPMWLAILGTVIGLAIIIVGGEFTVVNAEHIAEQMHVPARIIGLTIIGAGTSLPELIIVLIACKKREGDMALGTVVGTNVYNLLFILGVAGTIDPFLITTTQMLDLAVLTVGNIMFMFFILNGRRKITRFEGASMVALYLGYIVYAIAW